MYEHTFHYTDRSDFITQLDDMRVKLTEQEEMEDFQTVRNRYPQLSDSAFYMRLKRFRGRYPKQWDTGRRKTVKLCVTPALHAHLSS